MSLDVTTNTDIGEPLVTICGPEGFTPEQWAAMAVHRIIAIAETAPEPIRSQAQALREYMINVIAATVRDAIQHKTCL